MAEQLSTPRITAPYLDNFVNRHVLLVGKVTQLRGEQATLDSEGTVTVILNRESHLANGNAAQVIGKVNPDLSIKVLSAKDLGPGIDHGAYHLRRPQHDTALMITTNNPLHPTRIAMVWSDNVNEYYPCDNSISPTRSRLRASSFAASSVMLGMTMTTANFNSSGSHYAPSVSSFSRSHVISSASLSVTPAEMAVPGPLLASVSASTVDYNDAYDYDYDYDDGDGDNSDDDSLRYIPSAQPVAPPSPYPSNPLSQQTASSSWPSSQVSTGPGSYLPSPPPSQPSLPPRKSMSLAQNPLVAKYQHNHACNQRATKEVASPYRLSKANTSTHINKITREEEEEEEEEDDDNDDEAAILLRTVVEGIGRITVSMEQDKAGRWRIKRTDEADELL